VLDDHV
jgi:hypothetical protein